MKYKSCCICKKTQPLSLFHKRGGKEVGYRSFCKQCQAEKDSKRYDSTERKIKYLQNHEQEKQYRKEYYQKNKEKYFVNKGRRKASLINATPKWYNDFDDFVLEEAYSLCKLRKEMLGVEFEVDHIIPLQGKSVCGLHWHKNWSVITRTENRSKGNRI